MQKIQYLKHRVYVKVLKKYFKSKQSTIIVFQKQHTHLKVKHTKAFILFAFSFWFSFRSFWVQNLSLSALKFENFKFKAVLKVWK